jgi:hypothetical protein
MSSKSRDTTPKLEEFRLQARSDFGFLCRDFGFHEVPLPLDQDPYLNEYAVWFASPTTRVVVEGVNYGINARVAVGRSGKVATFENYDLGDLLAIRRPEPAGPPSKASPRNSGNQLQQLSYYAEALRDAASDVLRGDHAIFPQLAARVERRRAEFAARRDPRA